MPKSKKSTKKAAPKKVKPKKQAVSYELADDFPENIKSPQQLLIRDAMKKLGLATAAGIADQIKDKLKTKQPAQRVVSFYLAAWKKRGLVKAVV
jgi:hypothetical protein